MVYIVVVRLSQQSNEAHCEDSNWANNFSNHKGVVLEIRHDSHVSSGEVYVYRDYKDTKDEKTTLD